MTGLTAECCGRIYHEGIVVTPGRYTVISQISLLVDMEAMAAGTEAAQFEVEDSRVGGSSLGYRDSSARDGSDHDHLLSLQCLTSLFR